MRTEPVRIALLGAESTGKTSLSLAMSKALSAHGLPVFTVTEKLREWCHLHGRTPKVHEQAQIAASQLEAIFSIQEGWVIADTTPLMTAVYSDFIFQDQSLYDFALEHQSKFDVTLVMGLDVAWVADGLQRDGEHVREPVDSLLRQALSQASIPFKVIYGQGQARVNAALLALQDSLRLELQSLLVSLPLIETQLERENAQFGLNRGRTAWRCDLCSDADCEHKLFSDLLKS
jgi:HTH-type transcriptional regulator, transcriptional repressor of NAD biosynthesis genes